MKCIDLPLEEIKFLYLNKNKTRRELSKNFNVSLDAINDFLRFHAIYKNNLIDLALLPKSLTERQMEIVIGGLLGDAMLELGRSRCSFKINQSKFPIGFPERTEFIQWIYSELLPFTYPVREHLKPYKDRKITMIGCKTCQCSIFTELEKQWYLRDDKGSYVYKLVGKKNHRIKIVPDNFKLTPLTLAAWAMGDGYNCSSKKCFGLSTDGFSIDDCSLLVSKFKQDLNIVAKVGYRNAILIRDNENYLKIIHCIKPYILNCFNYKCDLSNYIPPKIDYSSKNPRITEKNIDWMFEQRSLGCTHREIKENLLIKFNKKVSRAYITQILNGSCRSSYTKIQK